MRLTGLLALLLFILIVFFAAPAASFAQTASPATVRTAAKDNASDLLDKWLDRLARGESTEYERDGVCYTMRTYVMAREDRNSDSTRMVRETRCLPGWKLEFKTAADSEHRSGDRPAAR